MSDPVVEIRDERGMIHKMVADWDVTQTIHKMKIQSGFKKTPLNKNCSIRQDGSDWYALTEDLCAAIIEADGDVAKAHHESVDNEEEIRLRQEAETLQQQEALALAVSKIHQLKAKCASGEWSLEDLQDVFHLVSNVPTTPSATSQEVDELAQAQNELINDVCKNPALSEPLKIMYANAQLGMQQQILNNLDQLSSSQANSNAILKQNQKHKGQLAAGAALASMTVINKLNKMSGQMGDIGDDVDDISDVFSD